MPFLTDHAFPPPRGLGLARPHTGYVGIAGERVTNKDHVVVGGSDRAATLERHFDFRQYAALLKLEASRREFQLESLRHDNFSRRFRVLCVLEHVPFAKRLK